MTAFVVKHWVCDFLLQNRYMLGKFKAWPDFVLPLTAHSAVNAIGTLAVGALVLRDGLLMFIEPLFWAALAEFVAHFAIDRIKASPNLLGRYKDTNTGIFWNVLGFDQMLHGLTYVLMISYILEGTNF
jgi:hypothetical protein